MKINHDTNLSCLAFSILKTLLPSLSRSEISGVRLAHPKSSSVHSHNSMTKFPSFIITLINAELVQLIMRAKKLHNYLTTNYINEVLSPSNKAQYILTKETAKKLGFKYVWHCTGKFLVWWNGQMRSHVVRSVSDLQRIIRSQTNINIS